MLQGRRQPLLPCRQDNHTGHGRQGQRTEGQRRLLLCSCQDYSHAQFAQRRRGNTRNGGIAATVSPQKQKEVRRSLANAECRTPSLFTGCPDGATTPQTVLPPKTRTEKHCSYYRADCCHYCIDYHTPLILFRHFL